MRARKDSKLLLRTVTWRGALKGPLGAPQNLDWALTLSQAWLLPKLRAPFLWIHAATWPWAGQEGPLGGDVLLLLFFQDSALLGNTL